MGNPGVVRSGAEDKIAPALQGPVLFQYSAEKLLIAVVQKEFACRFVGAAVQGIVGKVEAVAALGQGDEHVWRLFRANDGTKEPEPASPSGQMLQDPHGHEGLAASWLGGRNVQVSRHVLLLSTSGDVTESGPVRAVTTSVFAYALSRKRVPAERGSPSSGMVEDAM
jgi:hypothetical protein